MSTLRKQIADAILAAMGTVPSATKERSRNAPRGRPEGTRINVVPGDEEVEHISATHTKRMAEMKVMVLARGSIPDDVADAAIEIIHPRILADQTLGGLAARIVEQGTKYTYDDTDLDSVQVDITYMVVYLTRTNSLTSA